jgi:D-beta-D-heptose 7-phosphate kinase/D-beta-D-heptose 1-phosphate adenosyltransferase
MAGRLIRLVQRLSRPRLLLVGDLMLDRYVWGSVERISPEAPIQVLSAEHEEIRPGGAANVARNLAALGAHVVCAGVVGADAAGAQLTRLLRESAVDVRDVVATSARPTPLKTRMIARNQQVLRVDQESVEPIGPPLRRKLMRAVRRAAARCDAAVVSDYHKGTLTADLAEGLVAAFARRRKPVLVGLKTPDVDPYRGATGAMLNRQEMELYTGVRGEAAAARALLRRLRLRFLVGTLGERGLMVLEARGALRRMPTMARAVYDVTGAGDSCLAGFAVAYASGLALADCAALANAAAGVAVGKVGTAEVRRDELIGALSPPGVLAEQKILGAGALTDALRAERARGRTIVFTNGCFDVLHPGHLSLLQFAKEQGDVLLVGLNTDRSVRALKGPSRPVFPQQDRARLLAALEAVDYVVLFDEPTPADLIARVRPDVLVKGSDWKGKTIVGADRVRRAGGRVLLAPLLKGHSSSATLRKMNS